MHAVSHRVMLLPCACSSACTCNTIPSCRHNGSTEIADAGRGLASHARKPALLLRWLLFDSLWVGNVGFGQWFRLRLRQGLLRLWSSSSFLECLLRGFGRSLREGLRLRFRKWLRYRLRACLWCLFGWHVCNEWCLARSPSSSRSWRFIPVWRYDVNGTWWLVLRGLLTA